MGRRSFEEIGHPLPNRINIVVSRTQKFFDENLYTASSVDEAIKLASNWPDKDIFIAGGTGIFKEAMPYVDTMYITEVDVEIENGDALFPEFDPEDFEKITGETSGDDIRYTRTIWKRKTK